MSNKIFFKIPNPCHEDWDEMTPNEQGRFCQFCQKTVINFAEKTDQELIHYFSNYAGNICGRFDEQQLERPITFSVQKGKSSFLKYAAGLLMPAFLISAKLKAQHKEALPDQVFQQNVDLKSLNNIRLGEVATIEKNIKMISISGRVLDAEDKSFLPGVSIILNGVANGVTTDSNGMFFLKIPFSKRNESLQISYIGYENVVIELPRKINKGAFLDLKTIELNKKVKDLSEIIINSSLLGRRSGGLMVVYQRIPYWQRLIDTLKMSDIKVFPNPVQRMGTVNVRFPNSKKGLYQIRVVSNTGQLFYSYQEMILYKDQIVEIHLNSSMAAGVYYIQIVDVQKKILQHSKLLIQ